MSRILTYMQLFKNTRISLYHEIIMFFLALVSISMIIFEITHHINIENVTVLHNLDIAIALIFLADFVFGLLRSENKNQFLKTRWWEIFACIPITTHATQLLRGLGMLRIFRIIRVISRVGRIGNFVDTLQYKLFGLFIGTTIFIILSANIFYNAEFGINQQVVNYTDSIWWAVSTITTTGFGDVIPLTGMGRFMSGILMISGMIVFGTMVYYIVEHKSRNTV